MSLKSYRFTIKCRDGKTRYVFCRSLNTRDADTQSSVIATDAKERAYVAYCDEQAAKDLAYFTEHANGCEVAIA